MLEVVQAEAREDLEMGKMGGREVVVYKFEEGEVGKSYFRLGADKTRTAGDKG